MALIVLSHAVAEAQTTRVSVASDGTQGNHWSQIVAISGDGGVIVFGSDASNLVADDTNGATDIFVHHRESGRTFRVRDGEGEQFPGDSSEPTISADGRIVAFTSRASNLVSGDANGSGDVFVHDRQTRETTRVSVSSGATQGNSGSTFASLSADGRFVAFGSDASNLVPGDNNSRADVFVHDRQTRQTTRQSVATDGTEGNASSGNAPSSSGVAISADGRVVAFGSHASNLVSGDTNGYPDIFVRVLQAGGCDGCPQAPGPPSNLTAQVRGLNVTFDWLAPTTGGPVEAYLFRVGLSPGARDYGFTTGNTAISFTATDVQAGTYYVRVHGGNSAGTGPASNEVIVTIGCAGPPDPPAGLRAFVNVFVVGLTWGASGGCRVTSYVLDVGRTPGASDLFAGDVGNVTALTAPAPPGTYYVRVRGRNEFGTSSPSNEVIVVVP